MRYNPDTKFPLLRYFISFFFLNGASLDKVGKGIHCCQEVTINNCAGTCPSHCAHHWAAEVLLYSLPVFVFCFSSLQVSLLSSPSLEYESYGDHHLQIKLSLHKSWILKKHIRSERLLIISIFQKISLSSLALTQAGQSAVKSRGSYTNFIIAAEAQTLQNGIFAPGGHIPRSAFTLTSSIHQK